MVNVLFVCMGNICRSPMAHGVFERQVNEAGLGHLVRVDSAGTHAYHVGSPPDERAQRTAMSRGVDLSRQRARLLDADDFERYDYVLVMDEENLHNALRICPEGYRDRVRLLLEFAEARDEREVRILTTAATPDSNGCSTWSRTQWRGSWPICAGSTVSSPHISPSRPAASCNLLNEMYKSTYLVEMPL